MKIALCVLGLCWTALLVSGCGMMMGNTAGYAALKDTTVLRLTVQNDTTDLLSMMQQNPQLLNYVLYFRNAVPLDVVQDSTMAEWLMRHGAKPNLDFKNHSTPFTHQALQKNPNIPVLQAMLKHEANVNITATNPAIDAQYTSSYVAGSGVGAARDFGHNVHIRTNADNETIDGVDCIDNRLAGESPLHYAAMRGDTACMNLYLSHDATVDITNVKGYTPLHLACLTRSYDAAKLLLDKGAKVNAKNALQETPYMICEGSSSKRDSKKLLELLKAHGGTE